jgi:hypothetical protein
VNTPTAIALITISSLSLLVSTATLAAMLIGAKKAQTEMDTLKMKTNNTVRNLKSALDKMEL